MELREPPQNPCKPRFNARTVVIAPQLALFILFMLMLFVEGMTNDVNHDEGQYIGSGSLALKGVFPIIDYPYYHQPLLPLVYGMFFSVTNRPLMAARIISVVAICITIAMISIYSNRRVDGYCTHPLGKCIFQCILLAWLFLNASLSVGLYAWEHPPATLLLVSAYLALIRAKEQQSTRLIFLSGLLLALAVGIRAPMAPLVLPFFCGVIYLGRQFCSARRLAILFIAGCCLGSLPVLVFLTVAPREYIFDLLKFHVTIDQAYLDSARQSMSLVRRLKVFETALFKSSTVCIVISFGWLVAVRLAREGWRRFIPSFEFGLSTGLFAVSVFAAVMKNVTFKAYPFTPVFLFILATMELYRHLAPTHRVPSVNILAAFAIVMVVANLDRIELLVQLFRPREWLVTEVHDREAKFINDHVGAGKVLTLSPLWPVEGGCSIYREFVTAPFAYRTAEFVSPEDRSWRHIVGKSTLYSFLDREPPIGIYTGWEGNLDQSLDEYALSHGYHRFQTPMKKTLFIKQ